MVCVPMWHASEATAAAVAPPVQPGACLNELYAGVALNGGGGGAAEAAQQLLAACTSGASAKNGAPGVGGTAHPVPTPCLLARRWMGKNVAAVGQLWAMGAAIAGTAPIGFAAVANGWAAECNGVQAGAATARRLPPSRQAAHSPELPSAALALPRLAAPRVLLPLSSPMPLSSWSSSCMTSNPTSTYWLPGLQAGGVEAGWVGGWAQQWRLQLKYGLALC